MVNAVLFLAVALSGCSMPVPAPAPASAPQAAGDPVSISYETGPCFGFCPVYRVAVHADGRGEFEGKRNTAVTGTHAFTVTPAQYQAFVRHLAPARPASGTIRYSGEACQQLATDLPSVEIAWQTPDRTAQWLFFYYGCDMEKNEALAGRLRIAPALLPIKELIGSR